MHNISKKVPTVLTDHEVRALLAATARAERDLRDHLLLLLALNTGLRLSELVALDVGDVKNGKGVKAIIVLQAQHTKGGKGGEVHLPERVRRQLTKYVAWKKAKGEDMADADPLFSSRGGGRARAERGSRLSARSAEHIFSTWQARAEFDRHVHFHCLRHTFASRLLRATGNLRVVQQACRHTNIQTTTVYTHPSADDLAKAAEKLTW